MLSRYVITSGDDKILERALPLAEVRDDTIPNSRF
jgi:hypothetical protein